MTTTLLSLVIIWMAVLPGALFIWAFEMLVGRWATGIRGGLLRSVGYSAVFHIIFLPLTYHVRMFYWDRIWEGRYVTPWVWAFVALYVIVPIVLGLLAGWGTRKTWVYSSKRYWWIRLLMGNSPAPRAWDHLFGRAQLSGWVRLRTKSGVCMAGFYGNGSYVASYPETQDIYISHMVMVSSSSDDRRETLMKPRGLLIRWDEVEYLEFMPNERSKIDV